MSEDEIRQQFEAKAKTSPFFKHLSFRRLSDGDYYELVLMSAFIGYKMGKEEK